MIIAKKMLPLFHCSENTLHSTQLIKITVFIRHSPSDVVVCQFPPDNDPQVHINKRNSCFVGGTWKLFLGLNLPKFWTRHFKLCEGAQYFLYSEKKIVTGARSV